MRFIMKAAAIAAITVAAPAFAATTIVNVSGSANASLDGNNGVAVALAAGTYTVTFTQDAFTAFSRFSGQSGCDAGGGNCSQGFENSARFIVDGTTYLFGDGAASGGIGPVAGGGYFESATRSFANSAQYTTSFTLTDAGIANFFLFDDFLDDNRGGVSLALTSDVPEPASWALMLGGFGLVGAALRRRRTGAALA